MQRINVLHIMESLSPYGGTPRKLLYLARNTNKDKYRIFVSVFQNEITMEKQFKATGTEVILLRNRKTWDIFTILDILSIIKTFRVNLVNTHFSRANIYGRIAALLSRVPVVVNEHGIPRNEKLIVKILDNLLSLFTEKIICNSHAVLTQVKKDLFIRKGNFEVVQNGIDVPLFFENSLNNIRGLRKKLGITPGDIVIANVSGFIPIRGHKTLIYAFNSIHKRFKKAKLLFVGDGPLREELSALTKRLGIEHSVNFMGYRNDVPSILGLAHIYVDPTVLAGGFGFNVMEAMLSGLPVIAVSGGVPPDKIIHHNLDGILVPPDNPTSMAKAIERLITNKDERKRLGEAGKRKVLEQYNAEIFVKKICRIYDEILNPVH
jgi:glycosyltransferase involved in cell wall biosynthesis